MKPKKTSPTKKRTTARKTSRKAVPKARKSAARPSSQHSAGRSGTFKAAIIEHLRRPTGATLAELATLTGWKPNSVRGFLHGPNLGRAGFGLKSKKPEAGDRRYYASDLEVR